MNILVILAHPDETSFNHAIASHAYQTLEQNGHTVIFHDLHKEKFDPLLPGPEIPRGALLTDQVALHCKEASEADGIIIIHPNWWVCRPPFSQAGWTVSCALAWLMNFWKETAGKVFP